MVRTPRNIFSLFLGLAATLLILPSCSLFERKSDSDTSQATETVRPEGSISDADMDRGDQPAIQTPDQAAADPAPGAAPVPVAATEDTEHPKSELHQVWGYSGVIGPDVWSKLDPTFKTCSTGKRQSPIDLKWTKPKKGSIETDYKSGPISLKDTGHTLQVNFKGGNTVNIRGETYELVHADFHSGSEHTISGNSLPMEAHLTHRNAKGQLAVLGVIIIEGKANPAIEALWSRWPSAKGKDVEFADAAFNPQSLLPDIKTHYNYVGSLTTPPCTEGVNWNVFNTPIEISKAQLLAFRKYYPDNSRPVQELNGRKVTNY